MKTELTITKNGKNVKLRPKKRKIVKNMQKIREYSGLSLGDLYNKLPINEKLKLYELHNGVYMGGLSDDDIDDGWIV